MVGSSNLKTQSGGNRLSAPEKFPARAGAMRSQPRRQKRKAGLAHDGGIRSL